jgi:nucleotide-binding universal stress UspA family protein
LKVFTIVKEGDAKSVLLDEAENLSANCIFLGTRNIQGALNRFLLGSVSAEIVRTQVNMPVQLHIYLQSFT